MLGAGLGVQGAQQARRPRGERAQGAGARHGAGARRQRAQQAQAAGVGARGERHDMGAAGARTDAQARDRARQACGLGTGHAAWARGLATGCALGALGLFSIRIDSVLFPNRFLDIVREPDS